MLLFFCRFQDIACGISLLEYIDVSIIVCAGFFRFCWRPRLKTYYCIYKVSTQKIISFSKSQLGVYS